MEIKPLRVDNLYLGVSDKGDIAVLKLRTQDGSHETLMLPSSIVCWIDDNLRGNPAGPIPSTAQPDITGDDWDAQDNRRVVLKTRCDDFTDGSIILFTIGDDRSVRLHFGETQRNLLLRYLRAARPHLVDLGNETGGSA